MSLFRAGVLEGRTIVRSGVAAPEIDAELAALGARIEPFTPGDDDAADAWAREHAPVHLLLHDARGAFGAGGLSGLRAAVDGAWAAVRAIAAQALIPAGAPGKIALIAPAPDAGPHAGPARAALVNLARTLSIEWARYQLTITAVLPGGATSEAELAQVACYIASPGGDYLTGCALELGATGA